jgi:HEAT repeat protein
VTMRSNHDTPILGRFGRLLGLTVRQAVETVVFPYQVLRDAAGLVRREEARRAEEAGEGAEAAGAAPRRRPSAARSDPPAREDSADPRKRTRAMEAIGELEIGTTESAVIEALHDPEPNIRSAAASAAARARLSSAVFSLILTLDDPEQEVRQAAQQAIERITEQEIAFDPGQPESVRRQMIEELKGWWKEVRFAQLADEFSEDAP